MALLLTHLSPHEALELRPKMHVSCCAPQECCWSLYVTPLQSCAAVVFLSSAVQLGEPGGVQRGAGWDGAEGKHNRAGPDVATSVGKKIGQELWPGQT